jgi:hypothetical protein
LRSSACDALLVEGGGGAGDALHVPHEEQVHEAAHDVGVRPRLAGDMMNPLERFFSRPRAQEIDLVHGGAVPEDGNEALFIDGPSAHAHTMTHATCKTTCLTTTNTRFFSPRGVE